MSETTTHRETLVELLNHYGPHQQCWTTNPSCRQSRERYLALTAAIQAMDDVGMYEQSCVRFQEMSLEDQNRADAAESALASVKAKVLQAIDAEEELDGPMPPAIRAELDINAEHVLRSVVRETKCGIRGRVFALLDPPSAPGTGQTETT